MIASSVSMMGLVVVVPLRIPRVTETREGLGLALAYVGEDGSESR